MKPTPPCGRKRGRSTRTQLEHPLYAGQTAWRRVNPASSARRWRSSVCRRMMMWYIARAAVLPDTRPYCQTPPKRVDMLLRPPFHPRNARHRSWLRRQPWLQLRPERSSCCAPGSRRAGLAVQATQPADPVALREPTWFGPRSGRIPRQTGRSRRRSPPIPGDVSKPTRPAGRQCRHVIRRPEPDPDRPAGRGSRKQEAGSGLFKRHVFRPTGTGSPAHDRLLLGSQLAAPTPSGSCHAWQRSRPKAQVLGASSGACGGAEAVPPSIPLTHAQWKVCFKILN